MAWTLTARAQSERRKERTPQLISISPSCLRRQHRFIFSFFFFSLLIFHSVYPFVSFRQSGVLNNRPTVPLGHDNSHHLAGAEKPLMVIDSLLTFISPVFLCFTQLKPRHIAVPVSFIYLFFSPLSVCIYILSWCRKNKRLEMYNCKCGETKGYFRQKRKVLAVVTCLYFFVFFSVV